MFKRDHALYLFRSGSSCREVAELIGISKDTVSNLHQTYRNEGLDGIPDKPKSGRPPRLHEG
ncbi:helix-turn-helix domain-containing protein, partial [Candidatus Desulfosporosinus nitrosoreducens]|uniref:helix-turn-helix domain-containing protein n=1 Tax=Candidatus Desulfosporosinus nitrosoreducens TaxID=3401928 RepID=UPI0035AC187D